MNCVTFQPIGPESQHAVTVSQTHRSIRGSEAGIHDTDLALNVLSVSTAGRVDVKLKLSTAANVWVEHLRKGQVNRSLHAQRGCGLTIDRYASLKSHVGTCALDLAWLERKHSVYVVGANWGHSAELHIYR